jgi:hypothetical protein
MKRINIYLFNKKEKGKINKNLCDIFMKDISLCSKLGLLVITGLFIIETADEFAPREGNLNMNKYYVCNRSLSFAAIMFLSTVLFGCTVKTTPERDIALVPDGHITHSTRLFRQQLVYCATQYLAETEHPGAEIQWNLQSKNLTINSSDQNLEHFLNICVTDAVAMMADVNDSGSMTISANQSSEKKRM